MTPVRPKYSLATARNKGVCRICGGPRGKLSLKTPFVYEHGTEHAHRGCLDAYLRWIDLSVPDPPDTLGWKR